MHHKRKNKYIPPPSKTVYSGSVLGQLVSFVFFISILVIGLCAYFYQDEFKAKDVVLSNELSSIVSSLHLTGRADVILRATHPELQQKQEFNQSCNSHNHEIYVLGCYREDQDRLFVFNVTSKELPGVREVTTAHELLHAVYHRLFFWEKDELDKQLQEAYDQLPQDSDLRTSMQHYRSDEFYNELHSRIGTEIPHLSDSLERYYAKFFQNRSKIVNFNEQYHGVFSRLKAETEALKVSIENKKQLIERRANEYRQHRQQLNNDIIQFNADANSGRFQNQDLFLSQRELLLQRTKQLKAEYEQLKTETESLNQDIEKYNQNIYHNSELIDQINSNSIPKVIDHSPSTKP